MHTSLPFDSLTTIWVSRTILTHNSSSFLYTSSPMTKGMTKNSKNLIFTKIPSCPSTILTLIFHTWSSSYSFYKYFISSDERGAGKLKIKKNHHFHRKIKISQITINLHFSSIKSFQTPSKDKKHSKTQGDNFFLHWPVGPSFLFCLLLIFLFI